MGRTGNPVLVRKALWDSGQVRSFSDLRGRPVAINGPAGGGEYTLGTVLRKNNMGFDDVNVVYMPFPDMVTALGGGSIDAAARSSSPRRRRRSAGASRKFWTPRRAPAIRPQ